jgi:hypothetical protein
MIVCVYRPGTMYRVGRVSYRECGWCVGFAARRVITCVGRFRPDINNGARASHQSRPTSPPTAACSLELCASSVCCARVLLSHSTALACPVSGDRADLSTTVAQHALVQRVSWSCVHAVYASHRTLSILKIFSLPREVYNTKHSTLCKQFQEIHRQKEKARTISQLCTCE